MSPTRGSPHAVLDFDWLRALACLLILCSGAAVSHAQRSPATLSPTTQDIPFMNGGLDSGFAQLDFAEIYLDQQNKHAKEVEQQRLRNKELIDSGVVSALDLEAPYNAVEAFNHATSLLKEQNSIEASKYLEKAIRAYPKFVAAHNALGLAYLDREDPRAKGEFETAANLDAKYPGSFLNLGLLHLSLKDFPAAQVDLQKAAALNPKDPRILFALASAQSGNHEYQQTVETAQRIHAMEHHGMANIHYLAASAALALKDTGLVQSQLNIFLGEDPTNPLAPSARKVLDQLSARASNAGLVGGQLTSTVPETANSEHLKAELSGATDEPANSTCDTCLSSVPEASSANSANETSNVAPASSPWVIRKVVDETALFFSVSIHGHMVSDLDLSAIRIQDNNLPPERIIQFLQQSKLPLRLALVIDTSGSVEDRFTFEKHAAEKFLTVLNGTSDLGFVAGFNNDAVVAADFSSDRDKLAAGVESLRNGGGTALFDALYLACWKLAAYPEQDRVARVIVLLTDGEDNSSHRSLKQILRDADAAGVTIYAVSTQEGSGSKTDADRILDALADRTGGEAMFPGDMLTFEQSLDKLRDLIRSRYLIAYKPAAFEPNGKYRTVRITAEKDGKHLQVHARKGYYSRNETAHN